MTSDLTFKSKEAAGDILEALSDRTPDRQQDILARALAAYGWSAGHAEGEQACCHIVDDIAAHVVAATEGVRRG